MMVLSTISCFLMALLQVSGGEGEYQTAAPFLVPKEKEILGNQAKHDARMLGIGGNDAEEDEFPFLARLVTQSFTGNIEFCTGTLVGTRHVLTALHCVLEMTLQEYENLKDPSPSQILADSNLSHTYVYLGENNREEGGDTYGVQSIISPPEQFKKLDIILLKLDREVTFTKSVEPIKELAPEIPESFKELTVVGWGIKDLKGTYPNNAHVIEMKNRAPNAQEKTKCQRGEPSGCTAVVVGPPGKTVCNGDSGAPVLQKKDHGEWVLVGVISKALAKKRGSYLFGTDLCDKDIDKSLATYTPFPEIYPWINGIRAGGNVNSVGGTVFSFGDKKSYWYRLFRALGRLFIGISDKLISKVLPSLY